MMSRSAAFDFAVVGGGVIGLAIAHGLAAATPRVVILDEGDVARRASRGNFALIWVQSKGLGMPSYGAWTVKSATLWPHFAAELEEETGLDLCLSQPGGYALCLSECELAARQALMMRMHNQPGWQPIPWEVHDHSRIARRLPALGPEVVGGIFCPLDGHVNSLRLFWALQRAAIRRGAQYLAHHPVHHIQPLAAGGFRLITAPGLVLEAERIVLAAGLGNATLAPMVGLSAPVRPQRGQVMVTERVAPFLPYPIATLRQTDEGGVMIGDSKEEAPENEAVGLGVLAAMARRAIRFFPLLASLNIVRSWAALRVMSPDGFPIYDQSLSAPGAFLVTSHSGITLAAAHSQLLAPMIARGVLENDLSPFSARRFDVSSSG